MLTTLEPTQSLNRYIRDGDNPELTEERLKASFDTEELAAVFYGGKQRLNRRRHLLHNVDIRPDLQDTKPQGHLSREEKYENQMRKSVQMIRHLPAFANPLDAWELMQVVREVTGAEGYGMSIHHMMFIPTLQNMLDEEQISWWLQKAVDGQIIGTYCQTEMGHGTNLSKLETIASYDPSTEEFVLHSPTITSLKWWPGGLGQTVNHVALVANLVTEGKNFGPHFFMVQIREMETHKPLPGIRVGDIGAKMGIKGVDNGFLGFDHYRIPRRNMLMKYSQVEKDGTYRPPLHAKIAYSTMTIIRTELVLLQVLYMQYATTIATRYSCIRRQGEIMKGEGEVKLIEYQTQQNRLIPCIAKTYAFLFAATEVQKMTSDIMEDMKNHKVNNGILADLHAISCCLKAYTTFEGTKIQEQCRFACGGHGFSEASFLPTLYNCAVAGCTMEGDNLVMLLQTARYLMKAAMMAKTGQGIGPSVEFLLAERQQQSLVGHVPSGDYAHYLQDFEHLARKQIFRAFDRMLTLSESGLPTAVAWTENQIELTRASRSFIRLFIARSYVKSVSEVTDRPTRSILTDLLAVSMSQDLISQTKHLLEDGYMSPKQVSALKEDQYCLLKKLRPQAVSLVDSFDCTDRELRSVLGRRDGQVYENLLDWALQSKMNQNKNGVNPSFEKYIKPMVMGYQSKL